MMTTIVNVVAPARNRIAAKYQANGPDRPAGSLSLEIMASLVMAHRICRPSEGQPCPRCCLSGFRSCGRHEFFDQGRLLAPGLDDRIHFFMHRVQILEFVDVDALGA